LGAIRVTKYLTDGCHLYEIASERTVQNYGLAGGHIRDVILRDAVTNATARVNELDLFALTDVRPEAA
jgi:hypothetical protein